VAEIPESQSSKSSYFSNQISKTDDCWRGYGIILVLEVILLKCCLNHLEFLQCLEKNWRTWNYQPRTYLFNQELRSILESTHFVMDDDFLFWNWPIANGYEINCTIIDRKTMTVKCVSISVANKVILITNNV
jgi:hypothetical protein